MMLRIAKKPLKTLKINLKDGYVSFRKRIINLEFTFDDFDFLRDLENLINSKINKGIKIKNFEDECYDCRIKIERLEIQERLFLEIKDLIISKSNIKIMYSEYIQNIVKIQSLIRGYLIRRNNKRPLDKFNYKEIQDLLNSYIIYTNSIKEANKQLTEKKIRLPNFPSEISENIVKLYWNKFKCFNLSWDTKSCDLSFLNKKIEVKGFSSNGPSSFGPSENWDIIYFVDCKKYEEKNFKIYEIFLSNKSLAWRNIKLNKSETFGEIADNNHRGKLRGSFETIFKPQLGHLCKKVFDGNLNDLI